MWRAGIFLLFAACAGAQTPYDLARDLTSHKQTEWKSIWKAWGIPNDEIPLCDAFRDCTVDLITITKPSQVILVLQSWPSDHYLRFRAVGTSWRYAGYTDTFNKNYGRRYEIARIGGKPFLKTSQQGANGSDWDSEIESWFDLSSEKFEPVFAFTPQGTEFRARFGIGRKVRALASEGAEGTIGLEVEIRFSMFGDVDLGFARYTARYVRTGKETKFTLHEIDPAGGSARPLSKEDFEKIVDIDADDGPSDEQLVQFAMPRLKEIASGPDREARKSLKEGIEYWKDSPEKREILALIDRQ